ncbi:MAG TPA: TIR domain-containing protein [Gemmata sp.]|jgi:hypothetical protein|nr:TIR domain-containing protein [Gemmata sp.]
MWVFFGHVEDNILQDFFGTSTFNLWFSVFAFVVGCLLFYFRLASLRPKFVMAGYSFWLAHWLCLIGIYSLFGRSDTPKPQVLHLADAESLLITAFFACYVFGDALRRRIWAMPMWSLLIMVGLLLMLLSSLFISSTSLPDPTENYFNSLLRIALPVLLGTISNILGGMAFLLRYGRREFWAVSLLLIIYMLAYGLVQLPAYVLLFASDQSNSNVVDAKQKAIAILGCLKIFKAGLGFYFFFCIRPFWRELDSEREVKIYPPWESVSLPRSRTGTTSISARDVFLSYCEEDSAIAEQIASGLEKRGKMCWFYKRDSGAAHHGYLKEMSDSVHAAKHFVLIISLSALESDAIAFEIAWARERNMRIRPVLINLDYHEITDRRLTWSHAIGDSVYVDGKVIEDTIRHLFEVMNSPPPGPFLFTVEEFFHIKPPVDRVILVGTIIEGSVRVGDSLLVRCKGGDVPVVVESIEAFGDQPQQADKGQQIGLKLTGIHKDQPTRGDLVVRS